MSNLDAFVGEAARHASSLAERAAAILYGLDPEAGEFCDYLNTFVTDQAIPFGDRERRLETCLDRFDAGLHRKPQFDAEILKFEPRTVAHPVACPRSPALGGYETTKP